MQLHVVSITGINTLNKNSVIKTMPFTILARESSHIFLKEYLLINSPFILAAYFWVIVEYLRELSHTIPNVSTELLRTIYMTSKESLQADILT